MPSDARWPRTYYAPKSARVGLTILALYYTIFEIAIIHIVVTNETHGVIWKVVGVLVAIFMASLLQEPFVAAYRDRVTLTADRITTYQMYRGGERTLRRDEISGRKAFRELGGSGTALIPNRDGLPWITIKDLEYATDAVFKEWIASIDDLDARDPPPHSPIPGPTSR